jgi:flagellar hook assembly protein FlgD
LSQNYPNPFNPVTNIKFTLKNDANVSLKVYDTSGKMVQTLMDGYKNAGQYSVSFDVSGRTNLSSGIYFYKLKTDSFEDTKKMTLIK